jgi:putative toxin-antitoxin system antitoxin component (TIGR02293 family)
MTVAAISEVLGGRKMFKRKVETDRELTAITREGLPVQTLTVLADQLSVERKTLAKLVGISERTLSRRLASREHLSAEESDRTIRVARVFAKATDTLGTNEKASRWLQTSNLALGGDVPLELLDTETGARSVETILYRIDYGIYS